MNDNKKQNILKNESGNITLFFLLISGLVFGSINYSLYMGKTVESKIKTQNTADFASYEMAAHNAAGLNMMSTNNLAIGAALHVAASTKFISRYRSILTALSYDSSDAAKLDPIVFLGEHDKIFADSANIFGTMIKNAKHLTSLNKNIGKNWLKVALQRSVQSYRLNLPGAIGLPVQGGRVIGDVDFKYQQLAVTNAKNAFCHTIRSSRNMVDRNNVKNWLSEPVNSLGIDTTFLNKIDSLAERATNTANEFQEQIRAGILAKSVDYQSKCASMGNNGQKDPELLLWCKTYDFWKVENPEIPVPAFSGCGLNYDGDLGEQLEYFANNETPVVTFSNGQPRIRLCHSQGGSFQTLVPSSPGVIDGHLEHHPNDYLGTCRPEGGSDASYDIGLVFPNVQTAAEADAFKDSLDMGIMIVNAGLKENEIPDACPTDMKDDLYGNCSMSLRGVNFFGDVNDENNVWERSTWAFAQTKAFYDPKDDDPASAIVLPLEVSPDKMRMQMYWPSWESSLSTPTLLPEVINSIKGS
ncbi:MAG: hypothetical protein KC493_01615 [Bacteriovoracaceae bacterium]|nr:hypothetical protein [Bacteriovoracaceae bacterium]